MLYQVRPLVAIGGPSSSSLTPSKVLATLSGCCERALIRSILLSGHASFVSGLTFSRGHYLTSVGWDGQMLFWRHFSKGRKSVVLSTASKGRQYQLAVEILEPVGGYKIGPSPSAQFLPSLIRPLACGCGFLVAVDDKLGGVTVACYTNS